MTESAFDPKLLSPLDLAFVGDGVYGLLVRAHIASLGSRPVGEMHRLAVGYVNASAQARAYDGISESLSEEEQTIFRRGRNGGAHPPKNANPGDYAKATGLEALFGYLYLSGQSARAKELFSAILILNAESSGGVG